VEGQSVGADGIHQPANPIHAHGDGLPQSDVADEQEVGGDLAHLKGAGQLGVLGHGPLAANPEGQSISLGHLGQIAVDLSRPVRPPGHSGDDQRSAQRLAPQRQAELDLVERHLR
jgi:hypothetical protein